MKKLWWVQEWFDEYEWGEWVFRKGFNKKETAQAYLAEQVLTRGGRWRIVSQEKEDDNQIQ